MNETLRARSCPWCHSIGAPQDGCKNIWHAENLADLQEARRVPIHEKVFATVGNVDHHRKEPVPDFENPRWQEAAEEEDYWSDLVSPEVLPVLTAHLAQVVAERQKLAEVNEGLRLQIEYLNAELAKALNMPPVVVRNHHGWTSHGHPCCSIGQIGGDRPSSVARCGGTGLCQKCRTEAFMLHQEG